MRAMLRSQNLDSKVERCDNSFTMSKSDHVSPITTVLREAIVESGISHKALSRETGIARASIQRFVDGRNSLHLDIADRIAFRLGYTLMKTGVRTMSQWEKFEVENKVTEILGSQTRNAKHPTAGRPFLTAYQLAIEFKRLFPAAFKELAIALGGEGQGPYALTTYLAGELAKRIKKDELPNIELAFLGKPHIATLNFDDAGTIVESTTHKGGWDTSLFRLR
jgi:plasmid maintenance system antidote protein VapI